MSITLISDIKQKNDGQFFLVDSDDIDVSAGTGDTSAFPTTSLTNFIKNIEDGSSVAGSASKLDVADTGSSTNPVYFANGVPVATGATLAKNVSGNAATATNASAADKLNSNAGDVNTPVYFSDGVPVACTSLDLNTTGSAARLATTGAIQIDLTSDSAATYTNGGNITPGVSGILDAPNGGTGNATGRVQIGQKSGVALGTNATSEGLDTQAIGAYSHAEGYDTAASGYYSHAEGYKGIASGDYAHIEGGYYANQNHIASGEYSHVEGLSNQALDAAGHAEGSQNVVGGGSSSHVEGSNNVVYGNATHVEGYGNTVGDSTITSSSINPCQVHVEGEHNTVGTYTHSSHVEGSYNTLTNPEQSLPVYGYSSHIEGRGNTVKAQYAHAEGYQNKIAEGANSSHAEGSTNTIETGWVLTSGTSSSTNTHAEGFSNTVAGPGCHVEGGNNTVQGYAAHAEGSLTTAIGYAAHAQGYGTIAHASEDVSIWYPQTAMGKYNIEDTTNTYALIIGNGTDENARSNAFGVDWEGNTYIGGKLAAGGIGTYMITPGDTENTNISIINEDQNATLSINNYPVPAMISEPPYTLTVANSINSDGLEWSFTSKCKESDQLIVTIAPGDTMYEGCSKMVHACDYGAGYIKFKAYEAITTDVEMNVLILRGG